MLDLYPSKVYAINFIFSFDKLCYFFWPEGEFLDLSPQFISKTHQVFLFHAATKQIFALFILLFFKRMFNNFTAFSCDWMSNFVISHNHPDVNWKLFKLWYNFLWPIDKFCHFSLQLIDEIHATFPTRKFLKYFGSFYYFVCEAAELFFFLFNFLKGFRNSF